MWRVTDEMVEAVSSADHPSYHYSKPLKVKKCKQADKVRSLCYNNRTQEVAVVSLNGFIHCWDAAQMRQVMSKKLPHTMENVCLSTDEDCQMYAVGSKVSEGMSGNHNGSKIIIVGFYIIVIKS